MGLTTAPGPGYNLPEIMRGGFALSSIYINGREITNPVAKFFIKALALLIVGAVLALVLFLVLPAVGVVVVGAVGIAIVAVVLALLAVPVFAVGGSVLGILLAPLAALGHVFCPRRRYYRDWD